MGDGGVTFAPPQHLMERFPTSESFCGANGGFNSKSLQFSDSSPEPENKMEVEKGDIVSAESLGRKVEKQTRLEVEKGEIILEKCPKSEIENGEIVVESSHSRKWELEKGEIVPENWRKGEFKPKKSRRGEERAAPVRKAELEKGEFVPEKCRSELGRVLKGEVVKEEFSSGKARKWQLEKGEALQQKGRKDRERYSTEDVLLNRKNPPSSSSRWDPTRETEISRSSTERRKRTSSRWDPAHEREPKKILRADEELRSYKKDYTRKYHGDYSDHYGLKGRKISEDNNLSTHPEKVHSPSPVERSYRNSSSRVSSSSRYASRHNDSSHSCKGARDRHCRSPDHSERSPHERARHHDHKDRSPERSSYDQARHSDQRRKSPGYLEKSPHDRLRRHGLRDRSPCHLEPSPRDRSRHREYKNSTPQRSPNPHRRARDSSLQRSPRDQGRTCDYRETKLKNGGSERSQGRQEEKLGRRDLDGKDSQRNTTARHSHNSSNCTKNVENQPHKEKEQQNPTSACSELPQVNEAPEELASMEEDMDICDTPPHVPVVADLNLGKWFYLDSYGIERGPSKLCDVRKLVEEGALQSDHLIMHSASDRWVTVENAASPLVLPNFPSIVSDAVTELANPPEASGNLLVDFGDIRSPGFQHNQDEISVESLSFEDLHIDERVESLMRGYTFILGMELETVGEALNVTFEHVEWEKWGNSEGFTRFRRAGCDEIYVRPRDEELGRGSDLMPKENAETRLVAPLEDYPKLSTDLSDWFGSLWSCKGGDWKRNDEVAQDRSLRKKLVLNEGYPLCQMLKSGYDDPRRNRKDELYPPSRGKKLDLPPWAFSLSDEKIETNGSVRVSQVKPLVVRGVKGTVLPVVRINACVFRDHGPVVCDLRVRHRSSDRHASSRSRSFSASSDSKSTSTEVGISRSRKVQERDSSQALLKCRTVINTPKDRICTADELELNFGDWYYLDGAGHEQGPTPFSELQNMAVQGVIQKHSSVFRKMDKVWVPITAATASEASKIQADQAGPSADSSTAFHNSHPQFIGFTRGKLHELVMKSYRSREFAAAINEVLDPWISTKQTKKEMDKHFPFTKNSALLSQDLSALKFQKSEDDFIRSGKRARSQFDESDLEDEMDEDSVVCHKHVLFDDLCGEAAIDQEDGSVPVTKTEGWGQLNVRILARIFHFLRTDLKSLAFSAATCKCWNIALKFYRGISRHVDFSSDGLGCTDSMLRNIMSGYEKATITSIVLTGCTNVSSGTLEEVLRSFPSISSIDIRGCNQFRQLQSSFKDVKWIKSQGSSNSRTLEESHSKIRSLKQITDRSYLNSKIYKGSSSHFDDSEVVRDSFEQDFIVDGKDPAGHAFRQGCYKRRKLFGARKASAVLSRDAHMRRWLCRKSEDEYKKMEEFLAVRLKEIMKENSFSFFVPKVAEIEDRMRNGYYVGHGLGSFKEDISRMCRDAIKAKNRGDTGDMNHIIMSFIQLVTSLEENSKSSSHERDEMMKNLKDGPVGGFPFTHSKYKKKHIKVISERKGMRSNGTSYVNGGTDYREYASDREIRRRLNKLNRKPLNSESETSDDLGPSEEDGGGDDETTSSDTESDVDFHSGSGVGERRGDGLPFNVEETLDSTADDREWGARMTKASLVPPVTRKYEVIDSYVIVADEEEVQRKMRVSLPDNYTELRAQKTSNEEADMDFPEVKDYKPRKKLGDEVLEQEVYGIDPYTHNLLLDSMPEESAEWPLSERHVFIEEVLLRELNKQVRHFTGTGNTPMMYPLRTVVEDIQKIAEADGNRRNMRMCQSILKAMQNRPDDNYVAYRKGLGVVCNKEEGFGDDDFVVEFLGEVYPAWKWFEKQDGIRSLQKNNKDPAPEFYNIYLERPKGDRDGYDLVVVDAMHKANYASRICHSCRPNCEAKVTAVDGQYQIGIYAVRSIGYGEEITFDYNSVTESKEEYEASVCLCGSQVCRGSYLNLTGEGAFQKVLKECHGILDRHNLMLEACKLNSVSKQDYIDLGRAGLGPCLLSGLPDWLIAYSAHLVRFINYERTKLPAEILNYNLEEKRKFFSDISIEVEKSEAEIQAEGVYNQRLQNLALTLDKVRYVMRCIFGDPKTAPPPLERIGPEALVSILWKGKDSLVEELLQCIAPHIEDDLLNNLKFKIRAHDPSGSDDLERDLRKSLLWLRDEIRNLPCSYKCRHDAAADLIHIYAYTECFFKIRNYKTVTSEPVYISPLDLGPKYADKMGPGFQEYRKTYSENYCLGQLIYWHNQANADPDRVLARARRGCLSLPDVASFYARSQKPLRRHVYGPRTLKFMLARMDKQPQRQWPKDRIWQFKSSPQIFGSPMLDAVLNKSTLDKEMVHWLKSRLSIFQATWDR